MVDQEDLVLMLQEIASYERGYKQSAFNNAASAIAALTQDDFNSYIERGHFMELHGVGNSVNKCIKEYIETGTMTRLEEHRKNDDNLRNPFLS